MASPILTADGLSVSRAGALIVDDISMRLSSGAVHLLVGPSGSGKTTLLCILAGLLTPDTGRIRLLDQDLAGLSRSGRASLRLRHIGFVFQAFRLLAALNAVDNVALPLRLAGLSSGQAVRRASELLGRLGMGDRMRSFPRALSGGEQQRVAVARATISQPSIILADEPTANLDHRNAEHVAGLMKELAHQRNIAVLLVTHDVRLRSIADEVFVMERGRLYVEP